MGSFKVIVDIIFLNLRRFMENYVDSGQNRESEKNAERPEISGFAGL